MRDQKHGAKVVARSNQAPKEQKAGKELSLSVSDSVYDQLEKLAEQNHSSVTEVVRLGLGLVRIAIQETQKGHRLVVADSSGKTVHEIALN